MKRLFALMLTLLLLLSFTACDTTPDPSNSTHGSTAETTEETTDPYSEITFEELSVYEDHAFAIVVSGIDAENPSGYTLSVHLSNYLESEEIENIEYLYETNEDGETEIVDEVVSYETVSKPLYFVLDSATVNGTAVSVSFSADIESGEKTYDQIVFPNDALAGLGIITDIALTFSVYDSSNKENALTTVSANIYPYGSENAA